VAEQAGFEARKLLRGSAAATLATATEGQPFASLVTPAFLPDLTALLLLSDLSEHTRHLKTEPRCALMVQGEPESRNPQTAPRVTLTGLAEVVPEAGLAALKPRWLARHPYAALYADFGDFHLWRITPVAALLVGGFARATRLRQAELRPDAAAVADLASAEAGILGHVNADHADALSAIATGLLGREGGYWRMVAVDPDGCDLAAGEQVVRLHWPAPVLDASGVRAGLVQAAREGRSRLTS
jgi:putative heme iron utilization protein